MKKNLVVLFGGKSVEHDISIITALQVMKFVPKEYNVIPVYIEKNGKWCMAENLNSVDTYLNFEKNVRKKKEVFFKFGNSHMFINKTFGIHPVCKVDCVLMCLHGNYGEDGSICACLDMCNIPYTSSKHISSAICMDKIYTKQILDSQAVKNSRYIYFDKSELDNFDFAKKKVKSKLGFPVIVKPANLGSSVGISVVRKEEELKEKIEFALEFDNRILIEEYLENADEFNCACVTIGDEIISSRVLKVEKGDIFSFDDKYISTSVCKSKKCKRGVETEISILAKRVYKLFDCKGVVRIDFLCKDGEIFVNEINSIPGSLSLHMFSSISAREIIENIVSQAEQNLKSREEQIYFYESDALSVYRNALIEAKRKK